MSRKKRRKNRGKFQAKRRRRYDRQATGLHPEKAFGQVYVSRGKCYHPEWCDAMNGTWLMGSNAIRVVTWQEAQVLGLVHCRLCNGIAGITEGEMAEAHLDAIMGR